MLHRILIGKRLALCAGVVLCVAAVFFIDNEYQILKRALFNAKQWWHAHEWKNKSLWLGEYQVVLDAREVEGIDKNLSGLTWNTDSQTLFAVVNNPATIVELSTSGTVLRHIPIHGFDDPEAVEYIGDGRFILADERTQKLAVVTIDADTALIEREGLQQITVGTGETSNKGIEGLAWDPAAKKLYAAKERRPVHIYEITGFPLQPNTTMDIVVASNRKRDDHLFVTDVSSLDFNQQYQHLLVLSDESKVIIEIDKNGDPISSLSLHPGTGLTTAVPQAEGIAMDDDNTLYLVSEPNLFYVFKKPATH